MQCSLFIMLCLGSMDRIISELCYKGTILQKNYRKMTQFYKKIIGKEMVIFL